MKINKTNEKGLIITLFTSIFTHNLIVNSHSSTGASSIYAANSKKIKSFLKLDVDGST